MNFKIVFVIINRIFWQRLTGNFLRPTTPQGKTMSWSVGISLKAMQAIAFQCLVANLDIRTLLTFNCSRLNKWTQQMFGNYQTGSLLSSWLNCYSRCPIIRHVRNRLGIIYLQNQSCARCLPTTCLHYKFLVVSCHY